MMYCWHHNHFIGAHSSVLLLFLIKRLFSTGCATTLFEELLLPKTLSKVIWSTVHWKELTKLWQYSRLYLGKWGSECVDPSCPQNPKSKQMTSLCGFENYLQLNKTTTLVIWMAIIKKALDLRQWNMIKCSDINYTKQNCLVPFHKPLRIRSERVFTIQLLKNKCLPYFS